MSPRRRRPSAPVFHFVPEGTRRTRAVPGCFHDLLRLIEAERGDGNMRHLLLPLVLLLAFPAIAQQSTSYKLTEHTFNAGGNPSNGIVLVSTSYKITLDAIGDGIVQAGLSGSSYGMDGGFGSAYPPPGEVRGFAFTTPQTLVWDPERSVGVYNLYRGTVNTLDGTVYGSCDEPDIAVNTTTDADPVPDGDGYYYLVTAENRLGEEGTKGTDSAGATRPNPSPCP